MNHYRNRDPQHEYSAGMNKNGVGFSFDLIPTFVTGRTNLRIHPDGNNPGTLGCIGLSGTGAELNLIKNKLKNALLAQTFIPCNINITGNPNHSNSPSGSQPNE